MTITKEWLMKKFTLSDEEASTIKSVGCMLGQSKSITITFTSKDGRNRCGLPTPNATPQQIQKLQMEINDFINKDSEDLFEDTEDLI